MMAQEKHRCAARQCRAMILPKFFMCYSHWSKVPRALQADVWRTYFSGVRNQCHPSSEYWAAVEAAQQAVALEEAHA